MAVYDSTNKETFANAIKWYDKVKKANGGKKFDGVLVGTKI